MADNSNVPNPWNSQQDNGEQPSHVDNGGQQTQPVVQRNEQVDNNAGAPDYGVPFINPFEHPENESGNAQPVNPQEPVAQPVSEQPTQAIPATPAPVQDDATQTLPTQHEPTQAMPPVQPSQPEFGAYAAQQSSDQNPQNSQDSQTPGEQPQNDVYRPAPQYGAYGPVPTQNQPQEQQPGAATPDQNGQSGQQRRSFFGAFGSNNANSANAGGNGQPPANGNPFGPFGQGSPQPNNGNGGAPQPVQPTGKPKSGIASQVITGVVAAVVAAALCLGLGFAAITNGLISVPSSSSMNSVGSSSGSGSAQVESGEAPDWQAVAKKVAGSVVAIQTQVQSNGQTGVAKGSGVIVDKSGNIVTNNHVVSGASQIQVTLSNGNLYSAKVVGTDVTTDLAVIKLQDPPSDLTIAEFADSDELVVGEAVMAIGNPLGYENTATTGIISALNRPVTVMDDDNNEIVTNAVQLDAAINPGNSGGPTFNAAGQIVGINSSIATSSSSSSSSSSSGSIGIGFAIPANLAKRVSNEIIKNGKVQHVALGVTVKTSTATADGVTRAGSQVQSVVKDGPAAKAGVQAGDVIVGYDGKSVGSNASLLGFVRASALNDTAKLTVVRSGKTIELNVTLDKEESTVNGTNRSNSGNGNSQNNDGNSNGYGNNGNGNSGNGDSDNGGSNNDDNGGGFYDPFNFGW